MSTIVLAGVGQLGSRYLQGLVNAGETLNIFCYDISQFALQNAKKRWLDAGGKNSKHKITFSENLQLLPPKIDIAMVTCGANSRLTLVMELLRQSHVRIWILEKVLTQTTADLDELYSLLKNEICFVNTPLYLSPLYRNVRDKFAGSKIDVHISGKQGIACNTIHFIDFICRWNCEEVVRVCTKQLDKWETYPKRINFKDVTGTIKVWFSSNSTLEIQGNPFVDENKDFKFDIITRNQIININIGSKRAVCSDGSIINGKVLLQSDITWGMTSKLLNGAAPDLPTLSQSYKQHRPFLEALTKHYKKSFKSSILPIT